MGTDTIFAAIAAICCGVKCAQIYIGLYSKVLDVFPMANQKCFVNTLLDVIRKRGAPDFLASDSAIVERSDRVLDVLRNLIIDDWASEPKYQHQNFVEQVWGHLKRNVNWIMNWRDVDPTAWLLCTQWCADVMNHTAEKSLGWRPPLQVLTNQTIDISIMLVFVFWDLVYVARYDDSEYHGQVGSDKSSEVLGWFVGFAHDCGHALTFKVLTCDSKRVINRSRLRLANVQENNLKLDKQLHPKPTRVYIESASEKNTKLPAIDIGKNPFQMFEEPEESPKNQDIPEESILDIVNEKSDEDTVDSNPKDEVEETPSKPETPQEILETARSKRYKRRNQQRQSMVGEIETVEEEETNEEADSQTVTNEEANMRGTYCWNDNLYHC